MALKDWSTTAASNASVGSIDFSENMAPNVVNDSARALMADVRTFYNNIEWRDWGHTPVRTGDTTFTISSASDLSSIYTVGRRLKCTDSSTLYATITASSYGSSTQTVTVSVDGGTALSASLSAVALGPDPTNKPINPYFAVFAYRTGTLNVAGTGAYGNLTLDAELFDSGSIHSTSSNTELFAAPSWATKARFTVSINWPTDTTGFRAIKVVTSAAADIGPGLYNVVPPVTGGATLQCYTTPIFPVTGGSSYKVMVAQSSGGVLAIAVLSTYVGVEFFP